MRYFLKGLIKTIPLAAIIMGGFCAVHSLARGDTLRIGTQIRVRSVSVNTAATAQDDLILVDATGGLRTVALPAAASVQGKSLTIKKSDASVNPVTLAGTIDGISGRTLTGQYEGVTIVATSIGWTPLSSPGDEDPERAVISSTCTVTSQSHRWISGISGAATNTGCTITIATGRFSSPPAIFATGRNTNNCISLGSVTPTATSFMIIQRDCADNAAGTSDAIQVQVIGPR